VAPGGFPPGAPTDPDVRDYRIRLFDLRVRYVPRGPTMKARVMDGSGSG
jgi:hypothetical protein